MNFRALDVMFFCELMLALVVGADEPSFDLTGGHPEIRRSVIGGLEDVGTVAIPKSWDRFRVFVWEYKTNAEADSALYDQAGLFSFHVDRGAGMEDVVDWALEQNRPYYVGHAAGKGILHLIERMTSQIEANLKVA